MEQILLFDDRQVYNPLASRLRPESLEDFVGQKHLLGEGKIPRQLIDQDRISFMIFWGPPGVGETTLASTIAGRIHARFINFSAVTSGIKETEEAMAQAEESRWMGAKTVVFVDEVHRFNKVQQDVFLPYMEKGSTISIRATTENPPFEINAALLSRCKVFVLQTLEKEDLEDLIRRAIKNPKGSGSLNIDITDDMIGTIAESANGDVRTASNTLEMAVNNGEINVERTTVTLESLEQCIGKRTLLYDKKGEEHYNLTSALHKPTKNSDSDAAVYWLVRMLEVGEDPLCVARQPIRFASEDIGMANSQALQLVASAYQVYHFLGMSECSVYLSRAAIHLSTAPKTNSVYMAYESAKADAQNMLAEPAPPRIRNMPTSLMKELHYGEDYICAHDTEEKVAHIQCLPDSLKDKTYYHPGIQGAEAVVKEKLEAVKRWKAGGERED